MQWAVDTPDASKLYRAPRTLDLKVGEYVVVRPPLEILVTLDDNACLDELPFMPQMLRFCGLRLRVRKRAHKMCDTVHSTGGRQMTDAVFLDDAWCDGQAYGGCEMACSIVWKEAWLRREADGEVPTPSRPDYRLDALVWNACRRPAADPAADDYVFSCQAVKMPAATRPLAWWSVRQYVVDYTSGNVPLGTLLARISFIFYSRLVSAGVGFGAPLRWLYNAVQSLRGGGVPYPVHAGQVPPGTKTPSVDLGLKAGDLVRVKSADQIMATVDRRLMNRGMGFHTEMVPYCGKTFRIKQRLNKIINEKTGRLITLKNSCLVLDGVGCHGRFTDPVSCPRALPPYWREIWLERVDAEQVTAAAGQVASVDPASRANS